MRALLYVSIFAAGLMACGGQSANSPGSGGSSSGSEGGSAAGKCDEVAFGAFPGVRSGDKPSLPKVVEDREVAAGHRKFHIGVRTCVGPAGNVTSIEVTEPSGAADLDAHVKQTVEGWTFCSFVPDRSEQGPRCDTLKFDYEITPQTTPASQPATPPPAPASKP